MNPIMNEKNIILNAGMKLVDDRTASLAPSVYPKMFYKETLIEHGTRINWNGVLKKATVDLLDIRKNNPDNAPELWEDLPYKKGYRIIPEDIDATLKFSEGEIGWWIDDLKYRSKKNDNVYTPAVRPEDWELVVE